MSKKDRDRKNRERFEQAAENGRVCCVFTKKGKPVYFNVPDDADDDFISRRAFEVKHGRPMTRSEELFFEFLTGRASIMEKALS